MTETTLPPAARPDLGSDIGIGGLPDVLVVGGGPSGLIAAEHLAREGRSVAVVDRMPSVGRKFLLAGRGGLNLTHSEPLHAFLSRYAEAEAWLAPVVRTFPPDSLRDWATELGEAPFVGSSGRVFPASFKATPLLRAWLSRLGALGVRIYPRHVWTGVTPDGAIEIATPSGPLVVRPPATLLALGGASWPRLGSDGAWAPLLARHGVEIAPLRPANMGVEVAWSPRLAERFAGTPLKRIALTHAGQRVRGEAMITAEGIEGGAIYALSALLRETVAGKGHAELAIDLKPDDSAEALARRLARGRPGDSLSNRLRKSAGLPPIAIALLREGQHDDLPREPQILSVRIKSVVCTVTGIRPVDRAISTAGGVARAAVTDTLMLKALPGVFVAGEMLDWEAPTGGYLLQAVFATGVAAARGILDHIARPS